MVSQRKRIHFFTGRDAAGKRLPLDKDRFEIFSDKVSQSHELLVSGKWVYFKVRGE